MKISRFGWLLAWSACMATGLSSDAQAGDLARAKARLTTTANTEAAAERGVATPESKDPKPTAVSIANSAAPVLMAAKPTPAVVSPSAATPEATQSPLRGETSDGEATAKPYRNVLREPSTEGSQPSLRAAEAAPSTAASASSAVDKPTTAATQPPQAAAAPPATSLSPATVRTTPSEDAGQRPTTTAPAVAPKQPSNDDTPDETTRKLFASEEEPTLTPELIALRKNVQQTLAVYHRNWTLNTRDHSPWEVMHAIVAYGVDTRLHKGPPGSETTTAIGHLCFSGVCKNQPILTIRNGELYALRGPGVQGHSGQFLAILAQSCLQRDYPLYVGGEKYTLEDLIEAEKKDCEAGTELTFKLISLMHYLPSDSKWTNFQGQPWSLDRLVREEIVQPIRGAACGGTHRLMGLSYAIRKREQRGEPITGIYLEAQKYIDQYHKYTFSLQNPDGSFSTSWFVRREARPDLDRRLQTTGHILEWLCFSLTDEQLRDPRVVKAVNYTANLLLSHNVSEWEVGHLGHALHALQIYNERVFGGPIRSFESLVTKRPVKTAQRPAPLVREAPDAAPRIGDAIR